MPKHTSSYKSVTYSYFSGGASSCWGSSSGGLWIFEDTLRKYFHNEIISFLSKLPASLYIWRIGILLKQWNDFFIVIGRKTYQDLYSIILH
jgi:hypothetical protein